MIGTLLLWNVVFFYTNLWQIYLEPVGFHLWLQSIDWFQPYYNDLKIRVAQHPVDLDKYMVMLSWGAAVAMMFGLLFLVLIDKKSFSQKAAEAFYKDKNIEQQILVFSFAMLLGVLMPYVAIVNYGDLSSSFLGKHNYPNFFTLVMYFEFVFLGSTILPLISIWTLITLIRLKLKKF